MSREEQERPCIDAERALCHPSSVETRARCGLRRPAQPLPGRAHGHLEASPGSPSRQAQRRLAPEHRPVKSFRHRAGRFGVPEPVRGPENVVRMDRRTPVEVEEELSPAATEVSRRGREASRSSFATQCVENCLANRGGGQRSKLFRRLRGHFKAHPSASAPQTQPFPAASAPRQARVGGSHPTSGLLQPSSPPLTPSIRAGAAPPPGHARRLHRAPKGVDGVQGRYAVLSR